jgi:hypothetical protein
MSESYKSVSLQHPVKFGDETISVLEFRRPTGADFRKVRPAESNYDLMLQFAAILTDLPDSVIDQIDGVDDIPAVLGVVGGFLLRGPNAGQTF